MNDLKTNSVPKYAKLASLVTVFVLLTACSHETVPPEANSSMIPPLESETEYANESGYDADKVTEPPVQDPVMNDSGYVASTSDYTTPAATAGRTKAIKHSKRKSHRIAKHSVKKKKHVVSKRVRAKQNQIAGLNKEHEEKVAALAQGSLSTDIAVPPPPVGTPEIVNGPDATLTTPATDTGFWNENWIYALIPALILGWVGFAAYVRKVRARNRSLVYNS